MRRDIRCPKCARILAKLDEDATLHIKTGRNGTEIIAKASEGKFHLICPAVYFQNKEAGKPCGAKTVIHFDGAEIHIKTKDFDESDETICAVSSVRTKAGSL